VWCEFQQQRASITVGGTEGCDIACLQAVLEPSVAEAVTQQATAFGEAKD